MYVLLLAVASIIYIVYMDRASLRSRNERPCAQSGNAQEGCPVVGVFRFSR